MQFSKSLVIAAVTLVMPFLGHADSVRSNPTFSESGYTFNNFACNVEHEGLASPGGCGKIGVNLLPSPVVGIQFSSNFSASSYTPAQSWDDATIDYHVSSNTPINKIGLTFNGLFAGYAITSVTESVFNDNHRLVGFAYVACGTGIGCTEQDTVRLRGSYTDLYVEKDINVGSYYGYPDAPSLGKISFVDQTFDASAAPAPTPEPSSFMLLGSALVGVGCLFRRRKNAAVKA